MGISKSIVMESQKDTTGKQIIRITMENES